MYLYSKRWGRVALLGLLLGVLTLGLTTSGLMNTVQAAEFRDGDHVVVAADEVIDDDLFIAGQKIEVDGTVKGDLFAMGSEVIINGNVEGSLIILGQTLQMNGDVKGSVYGSGYSLIVGRGAEIGRNLYFGGFSLMTEKDSSVGRSVYAGGYQVIINGDVADDVKAGSAALEINGTVGGNVMGQVDEAGQAPLFVPNFPGAVSMVAPGYRLGDDAKIGGSEKVEISTRAGAGETFANYAWRILRARLGEYIALLIVGILLLWLWPGMVQSTSTAVQKKPLPSAGWGCLVSLVFPILLVVAVIVLIIAAILIGLLTFGQLTGAVVTIGAVSIAWIAVVFSFTLSTVTKVVVALAAGRIIMTRFAPQMKLLWLNILSLVLGALIYELLRIIPVVGWIVALLTILIGLGAMFIAARQRNRPAGYAPIPPLPDMDPMPDTPEESSQYGSFFDDVDTVEESEGFAEIETPEETEAPEDIAISEDITMPDVSEEFTDTLDTFDDPDSPEKPDATI